MPDEEPRYQLSIERNRHRGELAALQGKLAATEERVESAAAEIKRIKKVRNCYYECVSKADADRRIGELSEQLRKAEAERHELALANCEMARVTDGLREQLAAAEERAAREKQNGVYWSGKYYTELKEANQRAETAEALAETYRVALEGAIRDLSLVGELRMPQSAQLSLRDRLRAALKREERE